MKDRFDLTGQVFGQLTVLRRSEKRGHRGARTTPLWECRCICGNITYRATDSLKREGNRMCEACRAAFATQKARQSAGYVGGTQLSKIVDARVSAANSSGVRGVQYDKRAKKFRARLKFQGRLMNFGSYEKFEDAVAARKAAELEYYGTFLEELHTAT